MILNFYYGKRTLDSVPTPSRYRRKNSEYLNHCNICQNVGVNPNKTNYFEAINLLLKRVNKK